MYRFAQSPGKYPPFELRYMYMRIGTILRVDYEMWKVDIEWLDNTGGKSEVSISAPEWSRRSYLGFMPEEGQVVQCHFVRVGDHVETYIGDSLPFAVRKGMNHDLHRFEDPLEDADYSNRYRAEIEGKEVKSDESGFFEFTRCRFRKLYPGQGLFTCTEGSEIHLTDSINISNASMDTLRLDEGVSVLNTLRKAEYLDGVRKSAGFVERTFIEAFKEDGSIAEEHPEELHIDQPEEAQETFLSADTRKRWIRTLCGKENVNRELPESYSMFGVSPLVEQRVEIQEFGDMLLAICPELQGIDLNYNDMGHKKDLKERNSPIIESSSGTLVGYDSVLRPDIQGKVLQPQIYKLEDVDAINTTSPTVDEIEVTSEEPDFAHYRYLPAAYMWKMPHEFALTRAYIAKEGNISFFVGATWDKEDLKALGLKPDDVEHQHGAGRAIDGYIAGSTKLVIDKKNCLRCP